MRAVMIVSFWLAVLVAGWAFAVVPVALWLHLLLEAGLLLCICAVALAVWAVDP